MRLGDADSRLPVGVGGFPDASVVTECEDGPITNWREPTVRHASSSTSRKAARSAVVAVIGMGIAFVLLAATPAAAQVIDEADRPAEDQIARLYQAVFGRSADEGGFAFWTEQYRGDGSLTEIAAAQARFVSRDFVGKLVAVPSG